MHHDELTWVDSVPVRQPRAKRIAVSEYEWSALDRTADGLARLGTRLLINSTEVEVILVEERKGGPKRSGTGQTRSPQPRLRVAGRSYLLFVEEPTKD